MAEHLSSVAEWKELETHYKEAKEWHMRDMFTDDPGRFDKFRWLLHLCKYVVLYFRIATVDRQHNAGRDCIQPEYCLSCLGILYMRVGWDHYGRVTVMLIIRE